MIEVNMQQVELPGKWELEYDAQAGFPATPQNQILHWREFNKTICSDDADATWVLANICDEYSEEWLDLRPYMIENPIMVSVFTKF